MGTFRSLRFLIIVLCALAIAILTTRHEFIGRAPNPDLESFGSLLASLLFASAILERALDVWLSLMMGGDADRLDAVIRAQKTRIESSPPAAKAAEENQLKGLLQERSDHQSKTRRRAMPMAMLAGLVISAIGLRSLEPLFEPIERLGDPTTQDQVFRTIDIIVTGTLLAGGSDGIHWIVALYRDWMDKNRSTKS